jgi:hypothetical protein
MLQTMVNGKMLPHRFVQDSRKGRAMHCLVARNVHTTSIQDLYLVLPVAHRKQVGMLAVTLCTTAKSRSVSILITKNTSQAVLHPGTSRNKTTPYLTLHAIGNSSRPSAQQGTNPAGSLFQLPFTIMIRGAGSSVHS